jgi:hypothetical protein
VAVMKLDKDLQTPGLHQPLAFRMTRQQKEKRNAAPGAPAAASAAATAPAAAARGAGAAACSRCPAGRQTAVVNGLNNAPLRKEGPQPWRPEKTHVSAHSICWAGCS